MWHRATCMDGSSRVTATVDRLKVGVVVRQVHTTHTPKMSLKVPKATGPDLFKPGYKVSR